MASGKGQGWEEKVQQKVFEKYLLFTEKVEEKLIYREEPIQTTAFTGSAISKSHPDFIIVRPKYIELVECKSGNHPSFYLAQAIGELLIYRSLIELGYELQNISDDIFNDKKIHLSICMVNGYEYGVWTEAHTKLLENIEKMLHEEIGIYLVEPIDKEKATKEYWDNPEYQKVKKVK
ncbi:MAG: hypothetical protein CVU78_03080 [Elusimicrobia bacterium HGW-Elusimicrobia-2]|nr:MAG: hypothetical protein CVU78_03080 [Elusimicrobia bacterium HGW-Elusimicrobia-2]